MLFIKKTCETLQDEERKVKVQIDEHLHDKSDNINLLKNKELEFKQTSNSLHVVEQTILKLENVIQEKKIQYVAFEETISYWQKKYDCAQTSLDSANKAHDANKRTIQELESELGKISIELMELRRTRDESQKYVELSDSQVSYIFILQ